MLKKTHPWQEALSDLITDPQELLNLLDLDPALLAAANRAAQLFPLRVPRRFLSRIEKSNPNDPVLKQILPLDLETQAIPGYQTDPLKEQAANPIPGLLHKYSGRVLVTLTGACAIHCRYCFRRHFPYADNQPGRAGWDKLWTYLQQDPTIHEVILSGGDPLAVNDQLLTRFGESLTAIAHIQWLRLHTRIPVVLPERITEELVAWFAAFPLPVVMVLHVNHANEINQEVISALKRLKQAGVTLLNQSVLLKGVNDQVSDLVNLQTTLFAAGVLPYYLHVLDKVSGAAHFDMPLAEAKRLHQALHARLPGYLVPRLTQEEPGKPGKTWLSTDYTDK